MDRFIANIGLGALILLCIAGHAPAEAAWEPTRPVEIIVSAGTGGGADQMARVIQGIVNKRNLMNQPMVVINKPGNAGGVSKEQADYYIDLMKKILATAEWQNLMMDGAFNQTALTGPEHVRWLEDAERRHSGLMKEAGFLAPK